MSKRDGQAALDGILLIDKATGWTSHDVVAKARGITRQRRIGHTGTLDPAATGLLVLCLGKATRLVEYMSEQDKTYEGEIALGARTDTDDADGQVIGECQPVPAIEEQQLREIEAQFTGTVEQVPPAYSAVKVNGQRAYSIARKGGELELEPRPVTIHELSLEQTGDGRLGIRVACGSGTYVRSLARDIGEALGCGAHLSWLRRVQTGGFLLDEAVSIEELDELGKAGTLGDALRAPDEGVMDLDAVVVANERGSFLSQGRAIQVRTEPWFPAEHARVYRIDGKFTGIGEVTDDGRVRPVKVLAPEG